MVDPPSTAIHISNQQGNCALKREANIRNVYTTTMPARFCSKYSSPLLDLHRFHRSSIASPILNRCETTSFRERRAYSQPRIRFSPSLCGAERGEGNSEGKGLGQTNRPLERRGGHGAQLWPRGVSCVAYKVYHEGVV